MTLREYRAKRDFKKTPEPSASRRHTRRTRAPLFVVQLHRATRLHFDFRLEVGDALASWAVPKGPSRNPADKRLAMRVEDHPLDYAGFEGRIPAGNYGAGEVIVWDAGTYETVDGSDIAKQIAAGSVKIELHGKKLRGAFALVKMRSRDGQDDAWLLIKERDRYATGSSKRDDRSILTKRTLDDVAGDPRSRAWRSRSRTAREPVELKRPDKVLFPADGYTKADLASYYDAVARWMLPHLADRPLSVERYPDGIDGSSFFEKNVPRGAPSWVRTAAIESDGARARVRYIICGDRRTLAYLANMAALTLHVWTSRVGSLDRPDYVFFDLDPGDRCPLARLAKVALSLHRLLGAIGLKPVVKGSGGTGLHVLVPLRREYDYRLVRTFGELTARKLEQVMPRDVTLERSLSKRPSSAVYVDYLQIGRGKTMVAPLSVRARPGAPVSMPLAWSDVRKMSAGRSRDSRALFRNWNIKTAPALLARADPWKGAFGRPGGLARAIKAAKTKW